MATDSAVPIPRAARRTDWLWGEDCIGVCDDGTSWTADGTVTMMTCRELGTIEGHPISEVQCLQFEGNLFGFYSSAPPVDDRDPLNMSRRPVSFFKEAALKAMDLERAMIASGAQYATALVQLTRDEGGRQQARRGWQWATRDGRTQSIEWLDAAPLTWEQYSGMKSLRTPKPRERGVEPPGESVLPASCGPVPQ